MKRVLLVNPFGIGDVLFTVPLIKAIRRAGAERVDVIVGSRTEDVLSRHSCVDRIFPIHKDDLQQRSVWSRARFYGRLAWELGARHYDTLVDLSLTREYALWSWLLLGIRRRVGFDFKKRGVFLTERIPLPEGFKDEHVVMHYRRLSHMLGAPTDDFTLSWPVREEELKNALEKLARLGLKKEAPFIALSPGGGASWGKDAMFKQWAPEKFSDVARYLAAEHNINTVILLGSKAESELARRFSHRFSLNVINAVGAFTLGETAAAISCARYFVGNDGGLLHVAKALGVPTVSVYGPVDPNVYGPYPRDARDRVVYHRNLECRPCYKKFRYQSDCTHRACLTELTAEEAIRQIKENGTRNVNVPAFAQTESTQTH